MTPLVLHKMCGSATLGPDPPSSPASHRLDQDDQHGSLYILTDQQRLPGALRWEGLSLGSAENSSLINNNFCYACGRDRADNPLLPPPGLVLQFAYNPTAFINWWLLPFSCPAMPSSSFFSKAQSQQVALWEARVATDPALPSPHLSLVWGLRPCFLGPKGHFILGAP